MPLTTVLAFTLVILTLPIPLAAQGPLDESRQADGQLPVQDVETAETQSCATLSLQLPEQSRACSQFHLAPAAPVCPVPEAESKSEPTPSERSDEHPPLIKDGRLRILLATGMAIGAAAGGFLNAYTETPHHSFRFTNEGFFGQNTYVGGADKASHLV